MIINRSKNGVKDIQAAAYNGACKVHNLLRLNKWKLTFSIMGIVKGQLISKCLFGIINSPKK